MTFTCPVYQTHGWKLKSNGTKKLHSRIMSEVEIDCAAKDADIRNYAQYLLIDESIFENRDLPACLKSKTSLENKTAYLDS